MEAGEYAEDAAIDVDEDTLLTCSNSLKRQAVLSGLRAKQSQKTLGAVEFDTTVVYAGLNSLDVELGGTKAPRSIFVDCHCDTRGDTRACSPGTRSLTLITTQSPPQCSGSIWHSSAPMPLMGPRTR